MMDEPDFDEYPRAKQADNEAGIGEKPYDHEGDWLATLLALIALGLVVGGVCLLTWATSNV